MKKSVMLAIGGVLLFTGCCKRLEWVDCSKGCSADIKPVKQVPVKPQNVTNQTVKPVKKTQCNADDKCSVKFSVVGMGVAPCSGTCSPAQAKAMARRSAILDGYKMLAEKIYGVKIDGRDSVKNMILQNSSLKAYVNGLIKGADIDDESFKDGVYTVSMSVKLNMSELKNYVSNN